MAEDKSGTQIYFKRIQLPLSPGKRGGANWELSDAKWGGRKSGGVARGVPLSSTGLKPLLLEMDQNTNRPNVNSINAFICFSVLSQFILIKKGERPI